MSSFLDKLSRRVGVASAALIAVAAAPQLGGDVAFAQTRASDLGVRAAVDPRVETLRLLSRPISVEFTDARLEDVMRFLEDISGVNFDVMWLEGNHVDGLEREATVSVRVREVTMLSFLERVLERAQTGFTENTWQFSRDGIMEVGPKTRLNRTAYVKLYDIRDLVFTVRDFRQLPELDLGTVVQGGRGGGGQQARVDVAEPEGPTEAELAETIIDILISSVDPDQWVDNGGDAASVRLFSGNLLIRAPDYMHRQIGGYDFVPSGVSARLGSAGRGDRAPVRTAGSERPETPTAGTTRYTPDGGKVERE